MIDPFLAAQLHSDFGAYSATAVQDPEYEAELEKIADAYAKEEAESLTSISKLLSKEQAKNHLKQEFKAAVNLEEHQILLKRAISCILDDGKRYLEKEEWDLLFSEISHASDVLSKLSYQEDLPETLFPYLGITQKGMDLIDAICRAKYQDENFSLAIALNALLTTLDPGTLSYWLHLGISYQESGFFEKAIKAYSICHLLDPSYLPAWIFCSECYYKLHDKEDARIEYEEASLIAASRKDKARWEEPLSYLKKCLNL